MTSGLVPGVLETVPGPDRNERRFIRSDGVDTRAVGHERLAGHDDPALIGCRRRLALFMADKEISGTV